MKWLLSAFIMLLLAASGGLVALQWYAYEDKVIAKENSTLEQEVSVTYRNGVLSVEQSIPVVPDHAYVIAWPNGSSDIACVEGCDRFDEESKELVEGDAQRVTFAYTLPFNPQGEPVGTWLGTLKDVTISYSSISIVDQDNSGRQWITGVPFVGKEETDRIAFQLFEGKGPAGALYLASSNMTVSKINEYLTVYTPGELSQEDKDKLNFKPLAEMQHTAYVLDPGTEPVQSDQIRIVSSAEDGERVKRELLLAHTAKLYSIEENSPFLSELILYYLTGEQLGGEKLTEVTRVIEEQLTDNDLEEWISWIKGKKGSALSVDEMDEELGRLAGGKTDFLKWNNGQKEFVPFTFVDPREIILNDEPLPEAATMLYEGEVYFTLKPIAEALGYSVNERSEDKSYSIEDADNQYRFFVDRNYFIYNGEDYGLLSTPVTKVGDTLLLKEEWVNRLLLVEMDLQDEAIYLERN